VLSVAAFGADAVTINGRIVNGTTGDTSVDATVIIVNPSGGMTQEQTVEAKDGRFTANIDGRAPIYLLRVDYNGVMYTSTVKPSERGSTDATVTIYEPTTSWDGVTVSAPHVTASRHGDHLSIERLYEISNDTDPPRALAGEAGMFHFTLPADLKSINSSYVSALGMPIERQPTETDVPGVYRMDYPLRPGLTRIGVSYTVPYSGDTYTLTEKLQYDLSELTIYGIDPDMLITAKGSEFVTREAAHDLVAYTANELARGTEIEIIFTGGSGESVLDDAQGEMSGTGSGVVSVRMADSENISLIVMLSVLLILTALVGVSAATPDPLGQPERVRAHYEMLVKRLAKLDDMAQADMISNEVYRVKREELKGQLASLINRIGLATAGMPAPTSPDISPARTKEQTNS